ncbi:uncharacterized protein LTR77_010454 [Saxophila tyrrhenica]|uniref:Uncharacterized protein n=1 Tax=Saxophila tyrrhenica TaxID=1690608 RepID=A0AAV9NVF1_9PEZI|nr:hypothetical protein LTR77_010454 [Saxophila tyrrhenica]
MLSTILLLPLAAGLAAAQGFAAQLYDGNFCDPNAGFNTVTGAGGSECSQTGANTHAFMLLSQPEGCTGERRRGVKGWQDVLLTMM